jgi:hypothetical protein
MKTPDFVPGDSDMTLLLWRDLALMALMVALLAVTMVTLYATRR